MDFAEWVVSGLDQLRSGQLPGGNALYQAVSAGLDGSPALDAYMNGGDAAARAGLVQAIAQALTANPGLEQQLRQAAEAAQNAQNAQNTEAAQNAQILQNEQGGQTAGAGAAGTPFFKTTNGMLAIVAAAVVVVGGGIGLGVGLSGDGSSGLADVLKGTWKCQGVEGAAGSITIGDNTWSVGSDKGTWKQDGSKATVSNSAHPGDDIAATGLPSGAGPIDVTVGSAAHPDPADSVHIKGSVSAHKLSLTVQLSEGGVSPSITCTK
ncbi:hypothetical protein [Catenulispora subtropica]|uniref:Uncharacterized protein n=1 Tax=Catenulispora subtropica TaxID=450798 RepID=A0ABP5BXL0_9ACTN